MEWSTYQEEFQIKANTVVNWFNSEYNLIRSRKVNVSIFDKVLIFAYGEEMKLNQVANLQIISSTQVLIKQYDRNLIQENLKDIAKAI